MIIKKYKIRKFLLLSLMGIFLVSGSLTYAAISNESEAEVYGSNDMFYVDIKGTTYGPYAKIFDVNVEYENWGFTFFKKGGTKSNEYYYNINGIEYGPYYKIGIYGFLKVNFSNTHFAFIYNESYSHDRILLDGKDYGPCESLSVKITDINYGFSCYSSDGEKYAFINGEKYYYDTGNSDAGFNIYKFEVKENNWGYAVENGDHEYYAVINGDKFGPFDNIHQFEILNDTWAIAYEKDDEYFVLYNNRPAYKMPLTKEQAGDYNDGVFHPLS